MDKGMHEWTDVDINTRPTYNHAHSFVGAHTKTTGSLICSKAELKRHSQKPTYMPRALWHPRNTLTDTLTYAESYSLYSDVYVSLKGHKHRSNPLVCNTHAHILVCPHSPHRLTGNTTLTSWRSCAQCWHQHRHTKFHIHANVGLQICPDLSCILWTPFSQEFTRKKISISCSRFTRLQGLWRSLWTSSKTVTGL